METIKILKLPKSKMQAIRQYTNKRAFAELGADGSPIGYYIEADVGVKPPTGKRTRVQRNPIVPGKTTLVLGRNQVSDPYDAASTAARVHRLAIGLVPARRCSIEEMLVSELGLTEQQAKTQISYAINVGKTLAADDA